MYVYAWRFYCFFLNLVTSNIDLLKESITFKSEIASRCERFSFEIEQEIFRFIGEHHNHSANKKFLIMNKIDDQASDFNVVDKEW